MNIAKDLIDNRSYEMRAMGYNKQLSTIPGFSLPWFRGPIKQGAIVNEDGSVSLSMYAPEATSVQAGTHDVKIPLEKDEIGLWTGLLQLNKTGSFTIEFFMDGNGVLNPMAPICYSAGKAANYVDIPDLSQDYLLLKDVPHGAVTREFFYSSVSGQTESCLVYTPPFYQEEPDKVYPVLYLQHGGGENETSWIYQGKTNFTMDNLIAEGKAVPFIIVMNNGGVIIDGKNEATCDYHLLPDLVVKDCIPFIEKKYRVKAGLENRAIAGLSMGSLQASWAMLRFPGIFSSFGLFTGFKDPQMAWDREKQPWLATLDDSETFNQQTNLLFVSYGIEETKNGILEDVSGYLEERGIRYVMKTYPGGHEWKNWRAAAAEFYGMLFRW
ncbi:MAG: esterase family protein [Erysipelotrichaceae bacterium]|nr:esterase family protein [Erysipelotrichaceae bacterium]